MATHQLYLAVILFYVWAFFLTANAGGWHDRSSTEISTPRPKLDTIKINKPANLFLYYNSCKEAYDQLPSSLRRSGYYYITGADGEYKKVYCDMSNGDWVIIGFLDMTLPGTRCPGGLTERTFSGKRVCGRWTSRGCTSLFFNTHGKSYKEVYGRVVGYQYSSPDAFCCHPSSISINVPYVDGISITHGRTRKHIFTYAAGISAVPYGPQICPCNTGSIGRSPPAFVGTDYYCESGNPEKKWKNIFYGNDTLWDGMTCTGTEPPCCKSKTLPYFYKALKRSTNHAVELRLCTDQGFPDEEVPIEAFELYVR